MEIIAQGNLTVELTIDECRALVEVLGKLTGTISERTFDIYDKLVDVVGGRDE